MPGDSRARNVKSRLDRLFSEKMTNATANQPACRDRRPFRSVLSRWPAMLVGAMAILCIACSKTESRSADAGPEPSTDQSQTESSPMPDETRTQPAEKDTNTNENENEGAHRHANRLIDETSPYLLQHAHNPVDWYPWGEEAFEAARREQKPIFLSIGYSTCYWCHVMERESFENEEIAAQMNRDFICIKVDREERPDVDDIYMKAVQILNNGQGGWPASIFLTPPPPEDLDAERAWAPLQPFWAGTYFPPTPQMGRPSFPQVLGGIRRAWDEQRQEILNQADLVASAVAQELAAERQPVALDSSILENAVSALLRIYDKEHGGFGREPKFPQPVFLQLLLETRDSVAAEADQALVDEAISVTLDRMAMGGMYDQVGGGFHRYATDRMWRVPHFEKMLYDNGQLAWLYARAAEITDNPYYREIAGEIGDYVLREMTDPETGAFYSAQDAEVDGREGLNYLWTADSVRDALADHDADESLIEFALHAYGLNVGTNFRDPHHPEDPAVNVLYLTKHPARLAEELSISVDEVNANLERMNAMLLKVRNERKQPHLDDKVITSWNGLMIAGLAKAGAVLGREDLIDAAAHAWEYINAEMRVNDNNLLARTSRDGVINNQPAFCEDYAFLAHGLIELHRARHDDHRYLDDARNLMQRAHELFWDDEAGGGYFDTLADQSDLFVRSKSTYDGAVPSANSVMLHNLIDLYAETGENTYLDDALATLKAISSNIRERSVVTSNSTRALARLLEIAPERVESLVPRSAESREQIAPSPDDAPVRITTSAQRLTVGPNQTAEFAVRLEISDGFHVNAHDPGDPNLRGLNIDMIGGRGLALGVSYPQGEPFTMGDQEIRVHNPGELTLNVKLSQNEAVARGPVKLVLTYQVCTNEYCLEPQDVELPVVVELVDGE